MKRVSILADRNGKIVSVSQFGDVGDKISGIVRAGITAEEGQTMHEIELPKDLENASLLEIHEGFTIQVSHGKAHLKKA